MDDDNLRYTIEVNGQPRKILSISNQSTGLIFDMKPAGASRSDPDAPVIDGTVDFERATFHHSKKSDIGNLITRTCATSLNTSRSAHFTRALKGTNSFAPVTARRFPKISDQWPSSDDSGTNISLGNFDPEKFNFVYCVFVGNKNRNFSIHDPILAHGINISQQIIGNYKILILYSFYDSPSLDHGISAHYYTVDPKNLSDPEQIKTNELIMQGLDDYNTLEEFFRIENLFTRNYLALSKQYMGIRCEKGVILH